MDIIIAKRLSVRLIIVQMRHVRNGFTIEIYRFMHSLRTFWHVPLRMPLCDGGVEIEVEDSEDRRRCQNESRCMEDG